MSRRLGLAAAAVLGLALTCPAARPKVAIPADGPAQPARQPPAGAAPSFWFPPGEELVYTVTWGGIPVGESRVWNEWVEENGRWLLAIRLRTRTNKVLSTIYPVDDFIESVVEPSSFLPVRFVKKLNEGNHRYDETTTFDHVRGVARWVAPLRNKVREFPIGPQTRDIPSLLYWLRQQTFREGQKFPFEVMADDKIYDGIAQAGTVEKIKLPRYGSVSGLMIEPIASFEGIFVRRGRVWIWVSRDRRRLALQLVGEVPVAKVRIALSEVRGPGGDAWVAPAGGAR